MVGRQIARYARSSAAPGDARARVTQELRGSGELDEGGVEDAALIVSELVTNALRAGSTAITVNIESGEREIRITVVDDAPGLPHAVEPTGELESGRGLAIVAALSSAWGVTRRKRVKEVWAELARSS